MVDPATMIAGENRRARPPVGFGAPRHLNVGPLCFSSCKLIQCGVVEPSAEPDQAQTKQ
jgi:hypothetical protein